MTILNKKSAPVAFDPQKHVDTQMVPATKRKGAGFVWGIKVEKGAEVALARLKKDTDTAEWVGVRA